LALATRLSAADVPNFVIIYADDLGYSQLSVPMMKDKPEFAHPLHQTPHLKKLAERGMRFSSAYAPSPVCTPSRASIQFGMTTARVGCISIHDVVMKKREIDMSKNLSIAEMIKAANKDYVTAFFGKGCTPMGWFKDHGYDVTDFNHANPNGNAHGDWWEPKTKTPIPEDDPKRLFSLARTSVDFLEKRAEDKKPFFLTISHYAVHVKNTSLKSTREKYLKIIAAQRGIEGGIPDSPELPKKHRALWENANYAAMMEDMDTSIGIVLDQLKAAGLEENTYVIFSSDNGGGSSNPPLQGGKAKMWEGGLRVPMIVAGPGIKPNSQCDQPVAQWDYLTTLHDLASSKVPLPKNLDGISLRPVLEKGNAGKLAKRDTGFVFHFPAFYTTPITSFRAGDYKLMRQLNTGEVKLFNVAKDMGESEELSQKMPEKTAEMIQQLDAYLKKVGAWSMKEVYNTRQEELDSWVSREQQRIIEIRKKLADSKLEADISKNLGAQLEQTQQNLKHYHKALKELETQRTASRWF
jgi:arylsulfatase A-like enzyme